MDVLRIYLLRALPNCPPPQSCIVGTVKGFDSTDLCYFCSAIFETAYIDHHLQPIICQTTNHSLHLASQDSLFHVLLCESLKVVSNGLHRIANPLCCSRNSIYGMQWATPVSHLQTIPLPFGVMKTNSSSGWILTLYPKFSSSGIESRFVIPLWLEKEVPQFTIALLVGNGQSLGSCW